MDKKLRSAIKIREYCSNMCDREKELKVLTDLAERVLGCDAAPSKKEIKYGDEEYPAGFNDCHDEYSIAYEKLRLERDEANAWAEERLRACKSQRYMKDEALKWYKDACKDIASSEITILRLKAQNDALDNEITYLKEQMEGLVRVPAEDEFMNLWLSLPKPTTPDEYTRAILAFLTKDKGD